MRTSRLSRRERLLESLDENEVIIDFADGWEAPKEGMSAEEYRNILIRRRGYLYLKARSGLTDAKWAKFLGISHRDETNYTRGSHNIPNKVLNRAKKVSLRINALLKRIQKGYENG
jgi:hypothetical protein